MTPSDLPARYAPERLFPSYAFVPGKHPHPVNDPQGHSFGQTEAPLTCPNADELDEHPQFLYAMDLFNHGYYWEAHEAWEGLWHACTRRGELADFLKALIHLAAAGVKAREGNARGVKRHAERARELFDQTVRPGVAEIAHRIASDPPIDSANSIEGQPVLGVRLDLKLFEIR